MKPTKFFLVKYRDAGMPTYTYFWSTESNMVYGPYFDSEQEATEWLNKQAIIVHEERKDDTT